jgi:hypothetical protein
LTLEDPETGEIIWVDTGDMVWRNAYQERIQLLEAEKARTFKRASVDRICIGTDEDYTAPLTTFFQERAKRIKH